MELETREQMDRIEIEELSPSKSNLKDDENSLEALVQYNPRIPNSLWSRMIPFCTNSSTPNLGETKKNEEKAKYDDEEMFESFTKVFPLQSKNSSVEILHFHRTLNLGVPFDESQICVEPFVSFNVVIDDTCHQYLEVYSSISAYLKIVRNKIETAKKILLAPLTAKIQSPQDDNEELQTLIEAWKFVVEETLYFIGQRTIPEVNFEKSRKTQIRMQLFVSKSRFIQLYQSTKRLLKILCLVKNNAKVLNEAAHRKCESVRGKICSWNENVSRVSASEVTNSCRRSNNENTSEQEAHVIWAVDGICLKLKDEQLKLQNCTTHHKLFFLDLFVSQFAQFADETETKLSSGQELLKISERNQNPLETGVDVDSLILKLGVLMKSSDAENVEIKYLLPKEKNLILQSTVNLLGNITQIEEDVVGLLEITKKLLNMIDTIYKRRTSLMKNEVQRPSVGFDKRFSFQLQMLLHSNLNLDLEGIFDSYNTTLVQQPNLSGQEPEPRSSLGIVVAQSSLATFFTITSSCDLKGETPKIGGPSTNLPEISPLPYVDIQNEYSEAYVRLMDTGIVDDNIIGLCSDRVTNFFRNSQVILNSLDENIHLLRNLMQQSIISGEHEELSGLLFWTSSLAKAILLTQLQTIPYWKTKTLQLVTAFVEESSCVTDSVSEYMKLLNDEEKKFDLLITSLAISDPKMSNYLKGDFFSEFIESEIDTGDISTHKSGDNLSSNFVSDSNVRISLTIAEYSLLLLGKRGESRELSKVVKFTKSEAEIQYKIVELGTDELHERIDDIGRIFHKLTIEIKTKTVDSLSGILSETNFDTLVPLERAVIVYSLTNIKSKFHYNNRILDQILVLLKDHENLLTVIDYMTATKFGEINENFLKELSEDALIYAAWIMNNIRIYGVVVNYVLPMNGRIEKRLETFIQENGEYLSSPLKKYAVIPFNSKRRASNLNYSFAYDPKIDLVVVPEESATILKPTEDDSWLLPLGKVEEYCPVSPTVPLQSKSVPKVEAVKIKLDKYKILEDLVQEFARKLLDSTFAVLEMLLNPGFDKAGKSVGFFQSLCFLVSVACAQMNNLKIEKVDNGFTTKGNFLLLTCLSGRIDSKCITCRNSMKKLITPLLSGMELQNCRDLKTIHFRYTKEMQNCLNSKCGIMDNHTALFYILEKSKNKSKNQQSGLKFLWDGKMDERLQVETLYGQTFDYSEMRVQNQLKLLDEMLRVGIDILNNVLLSFEKVQQSILGAFEILEKVRDFTYDPKNPNRFRPEEIQVMLRSIREQVIISERAFKLIDRILHRSRSSVFNGFGLVFTKIKNTPEKIPINLSGEKYFLDETLILSFASQWTPTESFPKSEVPTNQQSEEIIHQSQPAPSSRAVSQFLSSLRREAENLGNWNMSILNSVYALFGEPTDPNLKSRMFSGLTGLEILIGHAFLEMKDLNGLKEEQNEELNQSFKSFVSGVHHFDKSSLRTLQSLVESTDGTIRKLISSFSLNMAGDTSNTKLILDSASISKSTLNMLIGNPESGISENAGKTWIMNLIDVGSTIILDDLKSRKVHFSELSRDHQVQVTSRLLDVSYQIFVRASKVVKTKISGDTKLLNQSIDQLGCSLRTFTREHKLTAQERVNIRQALEILYISIGNVKSVLSTIQENSKEICQILEFVKLYKGLRTLHPEFMRKRSKNMKRKHELQKYIQELHSYPISVRLPIIL